MRGGSITELPLAYQLGAARWLRTTDLREVDKYNAALRQQHAEFTSGLLGPITAAIGTVRRQLIIPTVTTIGRAFGLSPEDSLRVAAVVGGIMEAGAGVVMLIASGGTSWAPSSYLILDGVSATRGSLYGNEYDFMGQAWEKLGEATTGSAADGRTARLLAPTLIAPAAQRVSRTLTLRVPKVTATPQPVLSGGAMVLRPALSVEWTTVATVPVRINGTAGTITVLKMAEGGNYDGADGGDPSNKEVPTIGGRKPINSAYAGKTHPSGVRFNERGFPDFGPHAKAEVELDGLTGVYTVDEALANKAVGLKKTPAGYVWHHVEDGRTMQLVPKDIHKAARHTGGSAVIRNGGVD